MSIHDKHEEEVKRLKKKYPDLKHLFFAVRCGCFFVRVGFLEIEEEMNLRADEEVSVTTLNVIKALAKIEQRAGATHKALLKEYNNEHTK